MQGNNYWGSNFGVRRYAGDGETLFAVVNAAPSARPAQEISLGDSSITVVYEAVSGRAHPVSGGKTVLDVKPYQLLALTTRAPEDPRFSIAVPEAADVSASVPLDVSTLGGASADLTVSWAPEDGSAAPAALPVSTLSAAGTNVVALSGLSPNTRYRVSFGLTNAAHRGSARILTFSTGSPAAWPAVSRLSGEAVDARTGVLRFALDRLGAGSSSATFHVRIAPAGDAVPALSFDFPGVSETGPVELPLPGLSSALSWTAVLTADNDAVEGVPLGTVSFSTPAVPDEDYGGGDWKPGLWQHEVVPWSSGDWKTSALGQDDTDRANGPIMAAWSSRNAAAPNPFSETGRSWHTQKMGFIYEGVIWLEGGKDYIVHHAFDDGTYVELDGLQVGLNTAGHNNRTVCDRLGSFRESGWHAVKFAVWDNGGGVGPCTASSPGSGFVWNDAGSRDTATASVWHLFEDPGDGSFLRTWVPKRNLVSLAGAPGRNAAGELRAPLLVDSWDADNSLVLFASRTAPADGGEEALAAWAAAAGTVSAAGPATVVGPGQAFSVALPAAVPAAGETWFVAARLSNARTGYEGWTALGSYTAPDDVHAPELIASLSGAAGYRDAAFAIEVAALGSGASSVSVSVQVGGRTYTVAEDAPGYAGVYRLPADLDYGTDYAAEVTVSNDLGRAVSVQIPFATLPFPLALGEASGSCNGTGTRATAKVAVTRADVAATLALYLDGGAEPAATWSGVAAGQEPSWTFDIAVDRTRTYRFVLSAEGVPDAVERAGSITGRIVSSWFEVPFAEPDYDGWALADGATDPHDGGAWTLAGTRNASALAGGGGARALVLSTGADGAVEYRPAFASEEGRALEVRGTSVFRLHDGLPDRPDSAPLAGLALGTSGGEPALFGWTGLRWAKLSGGAVPAAGTAADWSATLDFGKGTVAYRLGGADLEPKGTLSAAQASRVVFLGRGEVASFRGVYVTSGGTIVLVEPKLFGTAEGDAPGDGAPLPLDFPTAEGDVRVMRIAVSLADVQPGTNLAAFESGAVDAADDAWTTVAGSHEVTAEDKAHGYWTVDLSASESAKFVKLVASDLPIAAGTSLADLPGTGE